MGAEWKVIDKAKGFGISLIELRFNESRRLYTGRLEQKIEKKEWER